MRLMDQTPRAFALRTLLTGIITSVMVGVAMRIASARDGVSGGEARSFLTVAGTLEGVTGSASVTFSFRKGSAVVCSPTVSVTPDPRSAFSAQVPLDDSTSPCPATLFDGSDVTISAEVRNASDASVLSTVAATINPVPYARFANQYGAPDCPVGYRRLSGSGEPAQCRVRGVGIGPPVVCIGPDGADEVVRVGCGATAFWIDRYEASVWRRDPVEGYLGTEAEPSIPYGTAIADYPSTFPPNGQWTEPKYARSLPRVTPSRALTWFQADAACRLSGKRLAYGPEWLMAAQGTPDPPTLALGAGVEGRCITSGAARATGGRSPAVGTIGCESLWGAQDMIGNLREWTAEWDSAPGIGSSTGLLVFPWPDETYQSDGTTNVSGQSSNRPGGGETYTSGMPAAAQRGGGFDDGLRAGVFNFSVQDGPSRQTIGVGFRCVIPR